MFDNGPFNVSYIDYDAPMRTIGNLTLLMEMNELDHSGFFE